MQKILCQYGVYHYFGWEIPRFKEIGLESDKIYSVLKNGEFVKKLHESMIGRTIPIFRKSSFNGNPVNFISKSSYIDGIMFIDIETNLELSAGSMVEARKESGDYMGIHYDVVVSNPELINITLVERKKERIKFPEKS